MRRFWVSHASLASIKSRELNESGIIELSGAEAHHIQNVLRLKPGTEVCLIDGTGTESQAVITKTQAGRLWLKILEQKAVSIESPLRLTVGQGYLKAGKMDALLPGLTELGVSEWRPFFSCYTIPAIDPSKQQRRVERWKSIARESLKQCRRNHPLHIHFPSDFETLINQSTVFDRKLICWEQETAARAWPELAAIPAPQQIMVLVGPEGGFTSQEVARAQQQGFMPLSLGPRILRSETATLTVCALLQHRWGDLA